MFACYQNNLSYATRSPGYNKRKMMLKKSNKNQTYILFITGASGVGKTTLLKILCSKLPTQSTICLHFDSIGVPSVDDMIREYGSQSEWQRMMTDRWIKKILTEYYDKNLVILEGQVNLEFIKVACKKYNFKNFSIILIHCDDALRHERLLNRNQPELISQEMDN